MIDNVLEVKRPLSSKGISFIIRGCKVDIEPPESANFSINELAEIFDEAKRMAIATLSINMNYRPGGE